MSDARGAKEERFPSRLLCPRSLPCSLASSLQLKLEQDARTLSSWRCFERRGPERGEREGFSDAFFFFFSFRAGGGEREQGRPTEEEGPTCKEKTRESECAPLLSLPCCSRSRHRSAGAGDESSRSLSLQTDEEATGWGPEKRGRLSLLTFFLRLGFFASRRRAKANETNDDKGRNFSVTFLALSLVSPPFCSRSLRSPSFPRLRRSRARQSSRGRKAIEETTGEGVKERESKPNWRLA